MKNEFMKILEAYGYYTQSSIAKALHEKVGYYQANGSPRSTEVFLSQVLNWGRSMPRRMSDGLIQLCDGDKRLVTLFEQMGLKGDIVQQGLIKILDDYYSRLKFVYVGLDEQGKLRVLSEFQTFISVQSGLESKIKEDTPEKG